MGQTRLSFVSFPLLLSSPKVSTFWTPHHCPLPTLHTIHHQAPGLGPLFRQNPNVVAFWILSLLPHSSRLLSLALARQMVGRPLSSIYYWVGSSQISWNFSILLGFLLADCFFSLIARLKCLWYLFLPSSFTPDARRLRELFRLSRSLAFGVSSHSSHLPSNSSVDLTSLFRIFFPWRLDRVPAHLDHQYSDFWASLVSCCGEYCPFNFPFRDWYPPSRSFPRVSDFPLSLQ